jgi:hypothetical protein
MIIGLTGLRGSGKDTVGAYLVKQYGFERRAFADSLKQSVAALLDVDASRLDEWKNDPDVQVAVVRKFYSDQQLGDGVEDLYVTDHQTMRSFLQRYGTESHRDVFGNDFWVDQLLPVGGYYAGRAICVTDCRFANEYERIIELGGHVANVVRPGLDLKDPHRSEDQSWLSDHYQLVNAGTIEDLYRRVDIMLGEIDYESE